MADLSITVANVKPTSDTQKRSGTAGTAITIGQSVYYDASTKKWLKADADATVPDDAVGISLVTCNTDQPIWVATGGNLTMGSILTAGQVYAVSGNAGGICPYADLTTGQFTTLLGVATSTTNLKLSVVASETAKG